jgi:hypothetical protein
VGRSIRQATTATSTRRWRILYPGARAVYRGRPAPFRLDGRARPALRWTLGYGYDIDNRLAFESGTLASTILPASVNSVSYTPTNQVSIWNGTPTSYDAASNLKSDPASSYGLTWDERNLLSTVGNGEIGTLVSTAMLAIGYCGLQRSGA